MSEHGTRACYKRGCDRAECRLANTRYMRQHRVDLQARVRAGTVEIPHGTLNGYSEYGCRCTPCRAAIALYRRGQRV